MQRMNTFSGPLPERWGRMDMMSRTAVIEIGTVLQQEGLITGTPPKLLPEWTGGLIIGTHFGSLAVDKEYAKTLKDGPGMASPHLFSYTLPNISLAEAAIYYNLTGPVFSIFSDHPYNEARNVAEQWIEGWNEQPGFFIITGMLDSSSLEEAAEIVSKLTILYSKE